MTLSDNDRCAVLGVASSVLETRWPRVQAFCCVRIGPNLLDAHAAVQWPGVVVVTNRWTGQLLAKSLPGKPSQIDWAALG